MKYSLAILLLLLVSPVRLDAQDAGAAGPIVFCGGAVVDTSPRTEAYTVTGACSLLMTPALFGQMIGAEMGFRYDCADTMLCSQDHCVKNMSGSIGILAIIGPTPHGPEGQCSWLVSGTVTSQVSCDCQ